MKTKLKKATDNLEKAYKNCEYWERFSECVYYRKQVLSAQGWLTRRRNEYAKLINTKEISQ